jgi:hypothetical protein
MKTSLLRPIILLACTTANLVTGLIEKASFPQCIDSESCQPIIYDTEVGIFSVAFAPSGSDLVPCTQGGQNGCKVTNVPLILMK